MISTVINILGRIKIEGNEDIIKILREEITNGIIADSEGFSTGVERLKNDRRRNNSSNDSSKTTRKDEQTSRLYNRTTREESVRQTEINHKSDGNKSRVENSNQSSFSMQEDNKYSKQNENWQEYLDNNFKSERTRTNLQDTN